MAEEAQTCGKGLAENSALPQKPSELIAALAGVLERHTKALDLTDENSRKEHESLRSARPEAPRGGRPARGDRAGDGGVTRPADGPPQHGGHDGPEPLAAFERPVRVKRELLTLVEESL